MVDFEIQDSASPNYTVYQSKFKICGFFCSGVQLKPMFSHVTPSLKNLLCLLWPPCRAKYVWKINYVSLSKYRISQNFNNSQDLDKNTF